MDRQYDRSVTCCFTGHRPDKLPWRYDETDAGCVSLKKKIYDIAEMLYESGIRKFICGMALGCDTYFGEAVCKLKEKYEDVVLEAAVPCEDQPYTWSAGNKRRYEELLSHCDVKTVLQKTYTRDCMIKRNRYMVDHSCVLIAVYDDTPGGTKMTVSYAEKNNVTIIAVRP